MGRIYLVFISVIIACAIFIGGVTAGERGVVRTPWSPTPTPEIPFGPDIDLGTERRVWIVSPRAPETISKLDEFVRQGWGIERVDSLSADVKAYILRWPAWDN